MFWVMKVINVKVLYTVEDKVLLTSFYPFNETSCNDVTPKVINRFINGSFEQNIKESFNFEVDNMKL